MPESERDRPWDPAAADRVALEVAIMAERLAERLERMPGASEGWLATGPAFLHGLFAAEFGERRLADVPGAPLDRVANTPTVPLDRAMAGLGLTALESQLLVLAGLAEHHEGVAGILRVIHPSGEPRPTVGLAAQLFCPDRRDREELVAVLGGGAGVASGVLQLSPPEAPFFERSLLLADALWPVLQGIDALPAVLRRAEVEPSPSGLDEWLERPDVQRAARALSGSQTVTVLLSADSVDVAHQRAVALGAVRGVDLLAVLLREADLHAERLVGLHALTRNAVPLVIVEEADRPEGLDGAPFSRTGPPVLAGLERHPGPVVVCSRTGVASPPTGRPVVSLGIEPLTHRAQAGVWRHTLPELAEHAGYLATRHRVEPGVARAVAADARFRAELDSRAPDIGDVTAGVRVRSALAVPPGARLVRPRARWDDLVLPAEQEGQIREAVARLAHQELVFDEWGFLAGRRGARGVRLLFSGPPGTGKTLAAEVVAGELATDLLVVDISRVLSKWIGETEKNLAGVFDVAERSDAVLFFDEADALFGERTEVSDAHDRYANLETAYLLARLERFEGMAILSTNLRQNIDAAFVRRLEFVVEFPEPGREERADIWRRHFPSGAPLAEDVDIEQLARLYPVVGGVIRNAALAAGFLAADSGGVLTRDHVVHGLRREYAKAGRAFPGVPLASPRPAVTTAGGPITGGAS